MRTDARWGVIDDKIHEGGADQVQMIMQRVMAKNNSILYYRPVGMALSTMQSIVRRQRSRAARRSKKHAALGLSPKVNTRLKPNVGIRILLHAFFS